MCNLGQYQTMVINAKNSGGPDIWIHKIKISAYKQGVIDTRNKLTAPMLFAGACIGVIATYAGMKINDLIKKDKEEKACMQKEAISAETMLKQNLTEAEKSCNEETVNNK